MKSNLMIRDRQTSEQGTILQCRSDGRVRVLMDNGQIRDYRPKELVGLIKVSKPEIDYSCRNSGIDKKLPV